MSLNDFTIQRNMILMISLFFIHQFLHWSLMRFGIDFASMLAPLWHRVPCFRWLFYFFHDLLDWLFIDLGRTTKGSKSRRRYPPVAVLFRDLFQHTPLPFIKVKPTSATNNLFQLLPTNKKVFFHTCTFYSIKSANAQCHFYNFDEKLNVKKLKCRTPRGLILEQLLRCLASFCSPFVPLLVPFGSCWVPFLIYFDFR